MATSPPALDAPPPNPTSPPGSFGGVPAGPQPGTPDAGGGNPKQGLVKAGSVVEQALVQLAKMAPTGAPEINQARELIKQGLAKELAAAGQAPATSPTATGAQWQGGGFGAGGAT